MALHIAQNMFNGGELSPLLHGRHDQPRYQSGCSKLLNAVPLPQGGVTRRPGFIFCGPAGARDLEDPVRLVPFVFGGRDARMLEFGPYYMRVWLSNGTLQAADGGSGNIYEISTPYRAEDIPALSFAQSADVLFIASRKHPPAKISRYGNTDWRYAEINFAPATPAPGKPTLKAGGTIPGSGSQVYSYVVTAIDPVSGQMSAASASADLTATTLSSTYYIDISWKAVTVGAAENGTGGTAIEEYRVYRKKAGVYGFIGRALNGETTFRDQNIAPDSGDTPPIIKTPFIEAGNYPGLVFFHQQRLGWASTENRPLTVWLSQSANFESLAAAIPPKDDDAIEATLAGQSANRICWLAADRDLICLGCEGGEYLMKPQGSEVLTPGNVSFPAQGDKGSDVDIPALRAGSSVIFIQRGGDVIHALNYSYQSDRYEPMDLTLLSGHILKGRQVAGWAYQQKPHSIIWVAKSDGALAALTWLKEHEVIAWHRHETDGFVEAVAVLPAPDADQDLLWCVTRRESGGIKKRYVEIMHPWFESDDKDEAFFVDCGASYFGPAVKTIAGLEHLEGREVAVYADGAVYSNGQPSLEASKRIKVINGSITLPKAVNTAHVGLPFTSEVRPMRVEPSIQAGSTLMAVRRVSQVKLRLYQTLALKVGLEESPFSPSLSTQSILSTPVELMPAFLPLGDVTVPLAGGWQDNAELVLKVDTPTPATILALVSAIEIN